VPTAGHLGAEKHLNGYVVMHSSLILPKMLRNTVDSAQPASSQSPSCHNMHHITQHSNWTALADDSGGHPSGASVNKINSNQYSLVIQDYFTKWADAIPLPDQTAPHITAKLIKFFSTYGPPKVLHSDQGRNFNVYSSLARHWCSQIMNYTISPSKGWDGRKI